ncbi:MAG: hypothetical protein GX236_04065 [Clostridiaceae bacterium]|nr:hypothetical protein [Clostridiaceae bacterium]
MDYLSHEEVADVTLFNLRLSEGELMLYEGCIDFVLKNCDESALYDLVGCETREELRSFQNDLIKIIKLYVQKEFLPEKYQE